MRIDRPTPQRASTISRCGHKTRAQATLDRWAREGGERPPACHRWRRASLERHHYRRTALPYGVWDTDLGPVLFNRDYQPIWEHAGHWCRREEFRWVNWTRQRWFYNDGDTCDEEGLIDRLERLCAELGVSP